MELRLTIDRLLAGNQNSVGTEYRPTAESYLTIAAIEDGFHENSIAGWLCIASGPRWSPTNAVKA